MIFFVEKKTISRTKILIIND